MRCSRQNSALKKHALYKRETKGPPGKIYRHRAAASRENVAARLRNRGSVRSKTLRNMILSSPILHLRWLVLETALSPQDPQNAKKTWRRQPHQFSIGPGCQAKNHPAHTAQSNRVLGVLVSQRHRRRSVRRKSSRSVRFRKNSWRRRYRTQRIWNMWQRTNGHANHIFQMIDSRNQSLPSRMRAELRQKPTSRTTRWGPAASRSTWPCSRATSSQRW